MTIFTKERKLLLAIESSCDETSVAVVEDGCVILSNVIASQMRSHRRFGGVVPEVASRHHVEQITLCIEEALTIAQVTPDALSGVAVTNGPGLVGALLIGVTAAKAFAWAHQLPLIPVNHMAGHIYSAQFVASLTFPLLALLVSGGHTELVYMPSAASYEIIGQTRDDAVGEAYDKVGRVMGLAYPSGREIDQLAHRGEDTFHFPRAMMKDAHFDFSFSGLKSAFINTVHRADQRGETLSKEDLAASFQASVLDVLLYKTIRACEMYPVEQLVIAGGVAANAGLRERLAAEMPKRFPTMSVLIPPVTLCGDNAAMIAAAGFAEAQKGHFATWDLNAEPALSFPLAEESD